MDIKRKLTVFLIFSLIWKNIYILTEKNCLFVYLFILTFLSKCSLDDNFKEPTENDIPEDHMHLLKTFKIFLIMDLSFNSITPFCCGPIFCFGLTDFGKVSVSRSLFSLHLLRFQYSNGRDTFPLNKHLKAFRTKILLPDKNNMLQLGIKSKFKRKLQLAGAYWRHREIGLWKEDWTLDDIPHPIFRFL